MDKELLDKFKPDENEDYRICRKCGKKVYYTDSRYTHVCDDGELITHCLECGPIKNTAWDEEEEMPKDNVDHPSHYTDGKIEVIDFIEDKKLNYHRGNAIKYISRAGKKDKKKEIEDLQKAVWYLNREIERLKQAN